MSEQEAVRRLVKSGPELWAQCSDPLMLSKHLAAFGEIKITRLDPESTVAWEGESARGTVSLEPSGWGTRVRLTAAAPPLQSTSEPVDAPDPEGVPELVLEPEPVEEPELDPSAGRPRGIAALISSLLHRRRGAVVTAATAPGSEPELTTVTAAPREELEPESVTAAVTEVPDLVAELEAALDSLGAAHHRPYSRS